MLLLKTLLSLIFLTLSAVDATSSIHFQDSEEGTLRFATKTKLDLGDGRTLSDRDRARARSLINKHGGTSISITNTLYSYSAQVGVGDPLHNCMSICYYRKHGNSLVADTLLVDSGSANTWVGANQSRPYIRTKTSVDTGNTFVRVQCPSCRMHQIRTWSKKMFYSADVSGEEYLDTVTLSPHLVIKNQSIGAATWTNGSFEGLDGILGIGPTDLTSGSVNNTALAPTVMDNLYSQGKISEKVFGIYLIPSSEPDSNGELTFGGYDRRVITSRVDYVPLTNAGTARRYWGVNQSVSYGDHTILSKAAGVIDTGTTCILFATGE